MKHKKIQEKKEIEIKEVENPKELEIAKITFTFGMSKDEAYAILNKPKGQIARNMRKYMNSLVEHAAKKFFEPTEAQEEIVNNCNDISKKD